MTPLRFAYIGNAGPGSPPHATENHVAASLQALGHLVWKQPERGIRWRLFPRLARSKAIDVVLWTRSHTPPTDALRALQQLEAMGIPTVGFHLDRFWGLERHGRNDMPLRDPFFRVRWLFTADGGHEKEWAEAGVNHHWLPPGVFADECAPHEPEPERWPWDVVFLGSHPYPHTEWEPYRSAMIRAVHREFGDRFAVLPNGLDGTSRNPAIRGADLRSLMATGPVIVGDSCLVPALDGSPMTAYASDRIPESIGRGAFLVHPWVKGVTDGDVWTDGEHLVCYQLGDFKGLVETIGYYLDHPTERRRIAAQGRERVLTRDTYVHRMETVLQTLRDAGALP